LADVIIVGAGLVGAATAHALAEAAEWVSRERAQELEPALALPAGEADEIVLYREGAWYEPPILARALLERALTRVAAVHVRDPVTAMTTKRGRIVEVRTPTGRRVGADVIVNCAGPHAAELPALAGAASRCGACPAWW
jgi:glycine/D-amino acid oxidase-like deaminating enzyme